MGYETTLSISITVAGGPPPLREQSKIDGVTSVNTKLISFCSRDKESCTSDCGGKDEPNRKCMQKSIRISSGEASERIGFIAIKANRYTYKRCGQKKDPSGIAYTLGPCPTPKMAEGGKPDKPDQAAEAPAYPKLDLNWIRSDRVLLDLPGCEVLGNACQLTIYVDCEMFDCSRNDPDEIVVTVTYGVIGEKLPADAPCAA